MFLPFSVFVNFSYPSRAPSLANVSSSYCFFRPHFGLRLSQRGTNNARGNFVLIPARRSAPKCGCGQKRKFLIAFSLACEEIRFNRHLKTDIYTNLHTFITYLTDVRCLRSNGALLLRLSCQDGRRLRRVRGRRSFVQHKAIVHLSELRHAVLLQANEALQRRRLLSSAAHAMHDVPLLLLPDEEDVEDLELRKRFNRFSYGSYSKRAKRTHFTLTTVMRGLVLAAAVEADLDALRLDELQLGDDMAKRLHQARPKELEELWVRDFDVPRQIPAQVHHRHDALVALQLVPLVALDAELILPRSQRPDVPGDVIAPADGLHPVHAARVHPHQVPGPLDEAVDWNVCFVEVFQHRPPRAVQVVEVVLLAEGLDAAPVGVGHGEPLAVAGPDVDVDRAEVVVLLVAGRPRAGHFHVQLHGVHAQDDVADVRQHVRGRHHARERGQLLQLLELRSPLPLVREVDVRAKPKRRTPKVMSLGEKRTRGVALGGWEC